MSQLQIVGRVTLAMVLGAVIGFEREAADKPAGLRTHMLVAGAAALWIALGDALVSRFGSELSASFVRSDPGRIIQAIFTGVSFLGAGTIIRGGGGSTVRGLTTAASLLFTASVGVGIALDRFVLAGGATALALLTLRVARKMESWAKDRSAQPCDSGNS